ncbi:MAG TPA: PqqD family protein [Thermoanaerobaculia bacterium]
MNERNESSSPGPGSTFSLAPGVRLEPLGDGSAVLYSRELDQSLSLNHTGALLCSFADGRHTVSAALREIREVFPHDTVEEAALTAFLGDLAARQFLQWI